jgi:hypothetical protein
MGADIARVVTQVVTINVAALVVLVVLSFVGGSLAMYGLERFDAWLRRRDEKRPPPASDQD